MMTTLSIFIRGREFHISTSSGISNIYEVPENRQLADKVVSFIPEELKNKNIDKVVYSSGPGSFTTIRIINSIVRGMSISSPSIKFIGISNFLTYLSIVSEQSKVGVIAIPTMRGDHFTCEYFNDTLQYLKIQSLENESRKIYKDSDPMFENINFSEVQISLLKSKLLKNNLNYINYNLEVNYGFTPDYKH